MRRSAICRFLLLVIVPGLTASGCLFFPRRPAAPATALQPGSIQGTVTYMHTGQPAPGVAVSLLEGSAVALTDAQGRFSFPSLPAGWQTLYARKEGFVTSSTSVNLGSAQTEVVSFDLQPEEGHLHGTSGRVPNLCGSCHVLHSQQFVKGTENETCFQCHQSTYPRLSTLGIYNKTLHSAFVAPDPGSPVKLTLGTQARGDCSNCHEPHGINNGHRHLLSVAATTSSNVLCYACHKTAGSGHTLDYPGQAVCEAPDNPHMNPNPTRVDLLPLYPGSEAEKGECYNCHNPHGATRDGSQTGTLTTAMTRAEEGALCVGCHTYLGPQYQTTNHACSLCHNPHKVKQGGVRMVKKTGVATGELVPVTTYKTGSHRGAVGLLPNSYCLGCHNNNPGNPYAGRAKVPDAANTNFKNISTTDSLPSAAYRDLHKVHIDGPIGDDDGVVRVRGLFHWGDGSGSGYQDANKHRFRYYCFPGGYHDDKGPVPKTPENKVWCVDCHDMHPSPATPTNQRGRLLRTALITRATVTTNANGTGYDGKNSCGMNAAIAKCHAGTSRDGKYNGCDWCHTLPGSPGYSCDCTTPCPAQSFSDWGPSGSGSGSAWGFAHGKSHPEKGTGMSTRRTVML